MARNKDDWQVGPFGGDTFLQLEAVEPGEREIENEAAGGGHTRTIEEFLGGGEGLGLPAFVGDQQFQRFAHGDVVVNDEHDGRDIRHKRNPPHGMTEPAR